MEDMKGFWSCLLDLSFNELITKRIIRILYSIGIAFAVIAGVYLIFTAFTKGFGEGLLYVIAAPIAFLLLVIAFRVMMELLLTLFRIEENTRKREPQAEPVSKPEAVIPEDSD